MKIHMDYLENKVEQFQSQQAAWDKEKSKLSRSLETANDKIQLIKDQKDREAKELSRKLNDITEKYKREKTKYAELEKTLQSERNQFNMKLKSIGNVKDLRQIEEPSGAHSSKSINKGKYLA